MNPMFHLLEKHTPNRSKHWWIRLGASDTDTALTVAANLTMAVDSLGHLNWKIRRWAAKNKIELCFTPTYASWANPIEAHFGPLWQFTLANSHHPNHTVQTRALHAYPRWRNQNARHPDALAAQRRERARIRSERGIRWGGRPLPAVA